METIVIAYFISDHGFGHAARASAVMAAVQNLMFPVRFELFTAAPQWFFQHSLTASFGYHSIKTDIGMIQISPFEEDLNATDAALDKWLPFDAALTDGLGALLASLNCRLVISDISALGLAVAKKAQLPSLLVENFTWDFIYRSFVSRAPGLSGLGRAVELLEEIYSQVDVRIQTEPLCRRLDGTLTVNTIFRWPRMDRQSVRNKLGIPASDKVVLVSMGGIPDRVGYLEHLPDSLDVHVIIPGADGMHITDPRVKPLPAHSEYYHPDLINTADVLIGKAGYSTIAEAGFCGLPYGYILRPRWPESEYLERYILNHLPCRSISTEDHDSGKWIEALPELLAMTPARTSMENGAFQVARIIRQILTAS